MNRLPKNEIITYRDCWTREIHEEKGEESMIIPANGPVDKLADDVREAFGIPRDYEFPNRGIDPPKILSTNSSEPRILDSGDRTEFASGAVRDMREGKGRCDLLPLDVVSKYFNDHPVFDAVYKFQETGVVEHLYDCLIHFISMGGFNENKATMILEVAKHFEEGAKKYGDNNWRKGIPVNVYIDSGVRHYLKFLRGDNDEPHDRAFCWNVLCAIWTCTHKPELNNYRKENDNDESI